MTVYTFVIDSFDPLVIEIPNVAYIEGNIRVTLPDINIKLIDLSMGGIIPDARVESKSKVVQFSMTYDKKIKTGEIVDIIINILPELKKAHKIYQEEFDKKFLLDGKK